MARVQKTVRGQRTAPLSGALGAVAEELALAADEIDWLELRLGAARASPSGLQDEIQALDPLLQHIKGLAEFVSRLAVECEPAWTVRRARAAESLRLAAQKTRLGGVAPPRADVPKAAPGECELL